MYNIKVVRPPNVMYLLSEQNITIHLCMTSSAEDNSVILRAGDNRNYPPLRTIEKLYDSGIIIIYPTCVRGITYLSSEVIYILRGEAEEDIILPRRINMLSPSH